MARRVRSRPVLEVPERLVRRPSEPLEEWVGRWVTVWEEKDPAYRQYLAIARRAEAVKEWAREAGPSETAAFELVADAGEEEVD